MFFLFFSSILVLIILSLFLMSSKKPMWEIQQSSSFECGYSSYFFSRFSFSMHYYLIGLIFLFLDLELCMLMPFLNEDFSSNKLFAYFWVFIFLLTAGVLVEWVDNKLEWKF